MESVQEQVDGMDVSVIYGEKFGYQYPMRLRHFLRIVILATASYSETHEAHQDDHILTQLVASYYHGIRQGFARHPRISCILLTPRMGSTPPYGDGVCTLPGPGRLLLPLPAASARCLCQLPLPADSRACPGILCSPRKRRAG